MASKEKKFKKSSSHENLQKTITDFKSAFKYYKSKNPPPEIDTVIDVDNDGQFKEHFLEIIRNDSEAGDSSEPLEHSRPSSEWRVFRFKPVAGISIIKNVFSEDEQYYWSSRCIKVKL